MEGQKSEGIIAGLVMVLVVPSSRDKVEGEVGGEGRGEGGSAPALGPNNNEQRRPQRTAPSTQQI